MKLGLPTYLPRRKFCFSQCNLSSYLGVAFFLLSVKVLLFRGKLSIRQCNSLVNKA